jgi:soluble lytic murein transglycosylase-like protein
VRIALNARHLSAQSRMVAQLELEEVDLRNQLDQLTSRNQVLTGLRASVSSRVSERTLHEVAELVYRSSLQYGYDPLLVLAVIRVESRFNTRARGRFRSGAESGALGLMQLTLETAQIVGRSIGIGIQKESDLFDPTVNVPLGIAYLTKLIGQFQSLKLGILAYNQGPGVVLHRLRENRPLAAEYYERVLKAYYELRKKAGE